MRGIIFTLLGLCGVGHITAGFIPNDSCPKNQTFAESGVNCATCTIPDGPCGMSFDRVCYCNNGFVWGASRCILPEDCTPADKCGQNESFSKRGFNCFTCRNYKVQDCLITDDYQCYCNVGYVRDDHNRCVKVSECPPFWITNNDVI